MCSSDLEPLDVPHLDSYDVLLEPLVHPAGLNQDVNLSTLTWSTGTYHNTPYSYAKDGPNHEPQFIGVNFMGCLCIASSKCILGQLLHQGDCMQRVLHWPFLILYHHHPLPTQHKNLLSSQHAPSRWDPGLTLWHSSLVWLCSLLFLLASLLCPFLLPHFPIACFLLELGTSPLSSLSSCMLASSALSTS